MSYELVIFDNDGTLVDSEPVAHRVLSDYLTELGFPTTLQESYQYFLGNAGRNVHRVIAERFDGRLPEDFTARCQARIFAAFRAGLTPPVRRISWRHWTAAASGTAWRPPSTTPGSS